MKNLLRLSAMFVLSILLMTSCEEDTGIGGGGDPVVGPTVTVVDSSPTMTPGAAFTVRLSVTAGDNELEAISVLENGVNLETSRLTLEGVPASANPTLLFGTDRSGFTWDIEIIAQSAATAATYTFNVADVEGNSDTDELTITTEATAPSISLMVGSTFEATPSSLISVPISATAGTAQLDQVAVYEDGVLVDFSRLYYDELTIPFNDNPVLIPEEDFDSLMRTILIRTHETVGSKVYTISVIDMDGLESSQEFTVNNVSTGTALDNELMGILFNAGGPAGRGGLDLDNGESTGSSDGAAEIIDIGIDLSVPNASNWFRRVRGVNGFEMRYAIPGVLGLSETFSFSGVSTKEEISGIWGNTQAFTTTDSNGNFVSFTVDVGDTFVVSNGTNYYLVEVTEVNETTDDNDDNYVVNIKY